MTSERALHSVYGVLKVIFLALLCAYAVIMFSSVPRIQKAIANADRLQAQELAAEAKFYCEKWGMPAGTHEHTICILDIQAIRAKAEQRLADDLSTFP